MDNTINKNLSSFITYAYIYIEREREREKERERESEMAWLSKRKVRGRKEEAGLV